MLLGYWTHSGFLNWDSGLGLKRWQIGKTFAFAQQGLFAIARADDFHARPEFGAWAKYFFDRGLGLYTRWADEEGGGTLAPPWLNGVHAEVGGGDGSKILFGARMAANAARAIDLGLGERAAQQPPPVYAYDPDIGRLAVSTPAYSTAVLAANHGAVGYGGIELARLYDGDGRPVRDHRRPAAARPSASVVRDVANRTLLASQTSRLQPSLGRAAAAPDPAPRGTGHVVAHPRHAYAAPFQRLDARGAVAAGRRPRRHRAPLPRRARRDHVDRDLGRPRAAQRRRALPRVDGRRADRRRAARRRPRRPRSRRRSRSRGWPGFTCAASAAATSCVVTERTPMHAHRAHARHRAAALRAAPGSTLALRLVRAARFRRRTLTARIAPARDADEAARVAAALSAR